MKEEAKAAAIGKSQITEGVIWVQLLLYFFPILFGTFFQQFYNTIDAVVVGRFAGTEALAAVGGPSGTLINLLVGFFVGLSSGATVIISQFYGARQPERVGQAVHTAAAFSLLGGLALMVIGIAGSPWALKAMGTPDEILGHAVLYMRIYFLGIIPNLIYNMGAGILRAIGNTVLPLCFLLAGCFTNVILDVVFVVFLNMGVAGAALATVISQLVSAVLVTLVLALTKESYRLKIKEIRIHADMLQRIIQIGFPAGLQSVMYSASNVIIQSSVNTLGTNTIAAWTAYGKIDSVFWMIISAFGISITTFVGQNIGAGKRERVHKGVHICMAMSFGATILLSVLLYGLGRYVFLLFTTDQAVIAKGLEILKYLVPTFITYVCIEIYSGSLRGAGDCWIPMIITCLGVCVLRMVWIWTAVPFRPTIQTIIFSYPLTWATTSILFFIYFNWFSSLRRHRLKGFR